MSLKYEPSSEPLHISVKQLFLNSELRVHTLSARGSGGEPEEFLQQLLVVDRLRNSCVHALRQTLLDLF